MNTEADATARRITDLYTTAVDQLGSEKAPVRLGGLYALECLAQDNPGQRQTIVNVLCAYLRMPFALPDEHAHEQTDSTETDGDGEGNGNGNGSTETVSIDGQADAIGQERRQEREVRLTAQRILVDHLRPGMIRPIRSRRSGSTSTSTSPPPPSSSSA